jgi:hypothetical protein
MEGSSYGLIKALSRHVPRRTKENHNKPQSDRWFPGRDLNPGPPKYETGVLITRPRHSIFVLLLKEFEKHECNSLQL